MAFQKQWHVREVDIFKTIRSFYYLPNLSIDLGFDELNKFALFLTLAIAYFFFRLAIRHFFLKFSFFNPLMMSKAQQKLKTVALFLHF